MTSNKVPYLCGGVLFFLLAQAKPSGGTARDHAAGVKDTHKAPIVMADLVYAVTGTTGIESPKDTSNYRECVNSGSINVPFNDAVVCDSYDNEVKNKYSATLNRMTEFVNWHVANSKAEWLVKAILEIIETDEGILDTDFFYLQPDGQPISKADVCTLTEFVLPALLVGAMHYTLIHRQDKNELGVATLNAIGTKIPRRERVYNGKLGNKIQRPVTVGQTCDVRNKHNEAKDTVISAAEQHEIQKKGAHSVIEELYASARAMATAWQSTIDQLADDMTGKVSKPPVHKRLNEEILSENDCALLEKFFCWCDQNYFGG